MIVAVIEHAGRLLAFTASGAVYHGTIFPDGAKFGIAWRQVNSDLYHVLRPSGLPKAPPIDPGFLP